MRFAWILGREPRDRQMELWPVRPRVVARYGRGGALEDLGARFPRESGDLPGSGRARAHEERSRRDEGEQPRAGALHHRVAKPLRRRRPGERLPLVRLVPQDSSTRCLPPVVCHRPADDEDCTLRAVISSSECANFREARGWPGDAAGAYAKRRSRPRGPCTCRRRRRGSPRLGIRRPLDDETAPVDEPQEAGGRPAHFSWKPVILSDRRTPSRRTFRRWNCMTTKPAVSGGFRSVQARTITR